MKGAPATVAQNALWRIALAGQPVDATRLANALDEAALDAPEDFRTRLLVRDSLDALAAHWGGPRLANWLDGAPARQRLIEIWRDELGPPGFPSLTRRIMDETTPETVMRFLRELGSRVPAPGRLDIGGSIALILEGVLFRHTEDIDIVDEVPAAIRSLHELLAELTSAYGLKLIHFQSHDLPDGWADRVHSVGRFGRLDVYRVDAYDVALGKLFSARRKDRDDLRALADRLDKDQLASGLRKAGSRMLAEPSLARNAADNWYIVYGEPLPA